MSFEVVECSERGLRYEVGERRPPAVGSRIGGRLVFRSGETLDVTGDVVRLQDGLIAVALHSPGIPFALVMREQRYLRGKGYQIVE
jgi:hypothetical protein